MPDQHNTSHFDEADLISLGEKLASLNLTDPERAALGELISDNDVSGFGRFHIAGGIRVGLRNIRGPGADPGIFGIRGPAGDPGLFGIRGPSGNPGRTGKRPGKPGDF